MKHSETEAQRNAALSSDAEETLSTLMQDTSALQDTSSQAEEIESQVSPGKKTADTRRKSASWRRPSFPSRERLVAWLPFWAVIVLGAVLRFWGLGDKPLHHDESLHAYYALQLLHNTVWQWGGCALGGVSNCYAYSPWLHGPFQFHAIALVYQIAGWLGAPDNGVNTTTVRIVAALAGIGIVGLPYFLRDYMGKVGAWLASLLLAVSPSMVYFSRFAREDIYYACFLFLMIVGILRYMRDRKGGWLLVAAVGFALAYATKEAIFLSIAVFGAFALGLIVWELGLGMPLRKRSVRVRLPRTFAPLNLLVYILVLGIFARFFFGWLKDLSIYITTPANVSKADAFVQHLKDITQALIPWLGVLLGAFILSILWRERAGRVVPSIWRSLATRLDPRKQRLLSTLLTTSWTSWFFAFLLAWLIFLTLYSALYTNLIPGIGDGIWQGLYYWLQQQQVNRGGQPWYYYLLLIPLYEQIGIIFALVGLARCLRHLTRFRIFLMIWFVGSFFLYSWAAEKMPWLMIHVVVPMLLLAAIGLEPSLLLVWRLLHSAWSVILARPRRHTTEALAVPPVSLSRRVGFWRGSAACFGSLCAVLLLIPTLQNMYQVAYVHPADSQHEMMVYVQTTVYVDTVMEKIARVDQQLDGGRHQLRIGVMSGAWWPFAWYLRDYPNTCLGYPTNCQDWVGSTPVILAADDNDLYALEQQLQKNYRSHVYLMRGQFDQGYMPPLCVSKPGNPCPYQPYWGYGPALWFTYGDTPPPGASFNPVLAFQHIWRWWWQRIPFGSSSGGNGGYNMELFIQNNINVIP